MLTKLFFPGASGVRIERVYREDSVVHMIAVAIRRSAKCPLCHRRSRRVHSRYERTIADLPCAGEVVTIHLSTRRFVCRVRWCRRKIFAERFPSLVAPFARKTTRLWALADHQPPLMGKLLMVVDDNDTNRALVAHYAREWGMLVSETSSPAEALAWIQRGESFDIAILDAVMPEMDGATLAVHIRRQRDAQTLPLVLFSALGRRDSRADGADFAAYLSRPLKPSNLLDVVMNVLTGRPARQRAPIEARQAPDGMMAERLPLRILVAEDNAVNQKLALRLLRQLGYNADVAGDGLEVIAALEHQHYDVVLMDVQMPELDGLDATRRICQRWARAERPRIVAMTANAMQGDRELCLEAGMDDYISKPIHLGELVAALNRSGAE